MLDLSTTLLYYKRKDIQDALVDYGKNREVVGSFKGQGFAKRPDTIQYPRDVIELVKQGITSFHVSEEVWHNPLQLDSSMNRRDLDELRMGWDLVLDIDCPFWQLSKTTAWLIIKALKEHGVKSISCKFSGNKGFHLGVPFEAFPEKISGNDTKDVFPEGPRKIAEYLVNYMSSKHTKVDGDSVIFGDSVSLPLKKIEEDTKKTRDEITTKSCSSCGKKIKDKGTSESKSTFYCNSCGFEEEAKTDELFKKCTKCGYPVEAAETKKALCDCGSSKYELKFNPLSVIEVDTILIASRHLYRMPYSLHEKSSLASVPIDPEKILDFEKDMAKPENVKINEFKFLNLEEGVVGECNELFREAFDFNPDVDEEESDDTIKKDFESLQEAAPRDLFPPCIKNILKGLKDGKKRSLFILTNFLTCCGWQYDDIEKILKEWNQNNEEQLREVLITGQLRYHKQNKKKVLPPNCPPHNTYLKDIGVCVPDNICSRIKNPVSYTKRKAFAISKQAEPGKAGRTRLTEEQKEMRRKHRKKLKKEKEEN